MAQVGRTVEFTGSVGVCLFVAEIAVFMPKFLDLFSFKEFCTVARCFYMVMGICNDFLIKEVLGFVCMLPEFREVNSIKCYIGQIIFLSPQTPIFHVVSPYYSRIMVTMDSTWLHLGNRSAAMAFLRV